MRQTYEKWMSCFYVCLSCMWILARRGGTARGCWVVANDDPCHPLTICRRNKSSGGLRARCERTNKEADSIQKWINQKGKILLLVCPTSSFFPTACFPLLLLLHRPHTIVINLLNGGMYWRNLRGLTGGIGPIPRHPFVSVRRRYPTINVIPFHPSYRDLYLQLHPIHAFFSIIC